MGNVMEQAAQVQIEGAITDADYKPLPDAHATLIRQYQILLAWEAGELSEIFGSCSTGAGPQSGITKSRSRRVAAKPPQPNPTQQPARRVLFEVFLPLNTTQHG